MKKENMTITIDIKAYHETTDYNIFLSGGIVQYVCFTSDGSLIQSPSTIELNQGDDRFVMEEVPEQFETAKLLISPSGKYIKYKQFGEWTCTCKNKKLPKSLNLKIA